MKLDRNINATGRGKYALLNLRKLDGAKDQHSPQGLTEIEHAVKVLHNAGILDWGLSRETEFFLIRLKDKYAGRALRAYAVAAYPDDREYAEEIKQLADRSGPAHPLCKRPD